jgi:hypothetical protein
MTAEGSPVVVSQRGLYGEHGGDSKVAPGKIAEGGAHPGRPSIARWRKGASAAVLNNNDRALVTSGSQRQVLQIKRVERWVN